MSETDLSSAVENDICEDNDGIQKVVRCSFCAQFYDASSNNTCPYCGNVTDKTYDMSETDMSAIFGGDLCKDYDGRCGNCREKLSDSDEFCRFCGTKRGEGLFLPYDKDSLDEQDPCSDTVTRKHKCRKCGFKWTTDYDYDPEKYCPQCGTYAPFEPVERDLWSYTSHCYYCGCTFIDKKEKCPLCGRKTEITKTKNHEQYTYTGRCFSCGKYLPDGDEYCRYCGAKINGRDFRPDRNIGMCIYGPPPVKRHHACSKCGYKWKTYEMIDYETHCPRCGGYAPAKEK